MSPLTIRRFSLHLSVIGALGSGLACRGPTETVDLATEYPVGLIFSADGADARFARATTPPTLLVLPGRLVVWGAIVTGTSCYAAAGAITQVGDSTTVTVETVSALPPGTSAGCPTRLKSERYRATMDAPAGPHRLRVHHSGVGFTGVVLDTLVVIPAS